MAKFLLKSVLKNNNTLKSIYNLIKEEVYQHTLVENSLLVNSKPWKRSHYVILSELIAQDLANSPILQEKKFELGTSISHVTLQRFFESDYDEKTHNDLRFLKTLDKICIFLGYHDLNAFVSAIKEDHRYSDNNFSKEESSKLVYQYCLTNFNFFKLFPTLDFKIFDHYIFPDAPFFERIKIYSTELCERNLKLITKNNLSNFEIFDLEIISDEKEQKVVKTQEYWNLNFIIEETGEE